MVSRSQLTHDLAQRLLPDLLLSSKLVTELPQVCITAHTESLHHLVVEQETAAHHVVRDMALSNNSSQMRWRNAYIVGSLSESLHGTTVPATTSCGLRHETGLSRNAPSAGTRALLFTHAGHRNLCTLGRCDQRRLHRLLSFNYRVASLRDATISHSLTDRRNRRRTSTARCAQPSPLTCTSRPR